MYALNVHIVIKIQCICISIVVGVSQCIELVVAYTILNCGQVVGLVRQSCLSDLLMMYGNQIQQYEEVSV